MSALPNFVVALLAFLKSSFTENLGLKALSLMFAVALFAFQRGQVTDQARTIPVGVVVRLPREAAKRELITTIPASIHVTLRGTTRAIDRLIQDGLVPIELDLRDGQKDRITFDASMLSLPPDVETQIFDPTSIKLEWDDVIRREIPIQASITGKPAEGYVVEGEPEVDPEKITVEGPRRPVETLQFARLAAFDVSGLKHGTYRRQIELDEPNNRIRYVGAPLASVVVTIATPVNNREFEELPVEVIGIATARTKPKLVRVSVSGPPDVVKALRKEEVLPRVDLTQAGIDFKEEKHGSTMLPVIVELTDAEATVQPPRVKVEW